MSSWGREAVGELDELRRARMLIGSEVLTGSCDTEGDWRPAHA